jgi:hypothetical protein
MCRGFRVKGGGKMDNAPIKNISDWDRGIAFGLIMGCRKELELHFDYMKSVFIDALIKIMDKDLVEQVYENIYTNQRSQDELMRIMNLIKHFHNEQLQRDKLKKKEVEHQ